jgi:dGTPase
MSGFTARMAAGKTVRERFEDRERDQLAPYAAFSSESKGRSHPEEEHPYRTAYQRDRDRILHSKAFRRLKRKTQVFLAPKGDHLRTRLTHTLEVAQIARTASRALFLNEDLVEAIALGHDLGHTPFGHAGEAALNECFEPGFRHFEQSLRIVEFLESTRHGPGLNLTHEVRDGILFHSRGKVVLLGRDGPVASTLEGQVLSICDAIAYVSHDIDDAIRAGVLKMADLPADAIKVLGETTSERINAMVGGLIEGSPDGKIDVQPDIKVAMNTLRDYLYREVYPSAPISGEIEKSKRLLAALYRHFVDHPPEGLPTAAASDSLERRVVDFLAGMTDQYALQLYQETFFPQAWPV